MSPSEAAIQMFAEGIGWYCGRVLREVGWEARGGGVLEPWWGGYFFRLTLN